MGIIATTEFSVRSAIHALKGYNPGQWVFLQDMALPIKHIANWRLLRNNKQAQNNHDNSNKNKNIVDHNY